MSNELRERIADIAAHEDLPGAWDFGLWVADQILALPGITVVELPEQMAIREEVPEVIRHQSMWEREYAWATIQDDGLIYFENGSGGSGYGTVNAAEARNLAAALLAAADYAEREQ